MHSLCWCTASKPRPSGWQWVESQQYSDGTNSSSERLAGASSPGSSDDFQHSGPTRMPNVQPASPKSSESLPKSPPAVERSIEARIQSLVSESQQVRSDWAGYGSKNTTDGAVYRSSTTKELTPQQQTSPRISPLPESHRVLTPPIVKAGDMPFISDRTFPMNERTNGSGCQPLLTTTVRDDPYLSSAGLPDTSQKSPTGTSKPPPPPRTVSVKPPEVVKSSQTSESYETVKSYSQSSSSESTTFSHSERFSDKSRSYEYSKLETSKSYQDFKPEDTAQTRTVPVQLASSPRHVLGSYNTHQHSEHPVPDPSRRDVGNGSSSEVCSSDSVGQSTSVVGTEPAAVDMLFSYHQMTQDAGDGQTLLTSSFGSRCSPAVMTPIQPTSSASSRAVVHPTHYYVWVIKSMMICSQCFV